jgi:precorrin-4/cobalt-precorrin-4 C11-methyltransferase
VSWPDQDVVTGTLANIRAKVKAKGWRRTALILVGHVLGAARFDDSRLYAPGHHHVLRPKA